MDEIVLSIRNVSKQYRLGEVGTGTLSHDLNRWWHKIRGLEDPYLKVGAVNRRSSEASEDYVWALKDINFDVKQGEVLGIIGKNGAGKSTLLKLLSQVTNPTTGHIGVRGRIASLLEVGTGFHPELTGRENIYLNGAILGMSKHEIRSKLDEIIEFAGVSKYIDTPVKRYSSGMKVRLGFAVAAHLEPEILVVDEVLAVGDAEFQKKAIGKMQDVSQDGGRTVLFVSHNMSSVSNLCSRALLLEDGLVKQEGKVDDIISFYLSQENLKQSNSGKTQIDSELAKIHLQLSDRVLARNERLTILIDMHCKYWNAGSWIKIKVVDRKDNTLFASRLDEYPELLKSIYKGRLKADVMFPKNLFKPGIYYIDLVTCKTPDNRKERYEKCLFFEIIDTDSSKVLLNSYGGKTLLAPEITWEEINE